MQAALNLPVLYFRVRIPAYRMADASKTIGAGRLQRLQHRPHRIPHFQVRAADDRGGSPALAVPTGRAFVRDALHELYLTYGAQFLGPICAVFRTRFHKHSGPHVVAAVDVRGQVG